MTAAELAKSIGKHGLLRCDDLMVEVEVLDAKSAYGSVRYLVEPVAGFLQQWVDESRIKFEVSPPLVVTL